ncbi:helix-turn-helix domain-containing protein [Actinoallomurus sp. CA-142502]|uniref:helix-turn-helix domain-containing protein n=1 Tax=Actinoallomurus sp. CA-142502 TaxID=3239885 RepID=UPI003D8A5278
MISRNSQLRVRGDGAILVAEFSSARHRFDTHWHTGHQLAWASSGMLTVSSTGGTWVLPPARALWIPAGVEHAMDADRHTTVCCPYFAADRGPGWTAPTVVAISPLARELILHLAATEPPTAARRRAESVLFDQLAPVPVTTIAVPMPRDPRALDVARAVIENPADDATLDIWARRTGTSTRTLARLFTAETGMPFGRWRTQVRLRAALPLLAEGLPVATAARRVGYTTPSAFVAVFRKATGVPPGAYFTSR